MLADRFSVLYMFCGSIAGAGVVTAFAPFYQNEALFVMFAVVYGVMSGSFVALNPVLIARYLGMKRFAQVNDATGERCES